MSASMMPPPGIDLGEDQGGRIVASMATLIVLPTLFVIARLLSRKVAHAGFWYDDLWVVIALFLSYGPIICVWISESTNGFGRHIWALKEANTIQFLRILYIYEVFYYTAVSAVKVCILLFYRRIFPLRELRPVLHVAMALVFTYYLGSLVSTLFQCIPIHKFWYRTTPGHCVNGNNIIVVPGAVNVVLDFFIVVLPLPLLWKLRTTVSQKSVLTGIFVCAGFVCIISITRLVVLSRLQNADVTWNYVNSAIWSAAEPCMGVISACLPSLRPLAALITRGTPLGPAMRGKSREATTSSTSSKAKLQHKISNISEGGHFRRIENPWAKDHTGWDRIVSVRGGKDVESGSGENVSLQEMNVPEGQIQVKEEIVITNTDWLEYKDRVY